MKTTLSPLFYLILFLWIAACQNTAEPTPENNQHPAQQVSPALQQLHDWQDTTAFFAGQLQMTIKADPAVEAKYCHALGGLPWYQILAGQPRTAVLSAQIALERCPDKTWIVTNLALAYLYSGQTERAAAVYRQWKDKPWAESGSEDLVSFKTFGEAFLADLDYLEKSGHERPEFDKIRAILQ